MYVEFINNLDEKIQKIKNNHEIIFCCIGTDRVIGDCVGPITGSLLKKEINNKIYGTLEENLTFHNIDKQINKIKEENKNLYIIAIDAALSNKKNIGKIFIDDNGICIGKGLKKERANIGNLGIKVVIGEDYNNKELNFKTLQNKSLKEIIQLSGIISNGIVSILNK